MSEYLRRTSSSTRVHDATTSVQSPPGKRTLAQQPYDGPATAVQRSAVEPASGHAHAAAARGVATPASALPHSDRIQRLFGRHDVSTIESHQGPEAAASAAEMGARAYATGNHVVLGAGGADLFTEAHEAAHVVQQRGGIQLKGGVGEAGDSHERHADEVASLVVQDQSAEVLLDKMAGPATTGVASRLNVASGVQKKGAADTSKPDRRPEPERRAEQSDNATYHAMNIQLKLLAYELDTAGRKLAFDMAVANADKTPDKTHVKETNDRMMVTIDHLDGMARDTAKQLDDLNTEKNEARLAEGGQYLRDALATFAPVMTEVDAWMVAHKEEPPAWEVNGRSNAILKRIFSSLASAAKPLNHIERSPGSINSESIDAHLDAAISAAQSVKSGNRYQSDRIILHAKEIGELTANHPVLAGGLEPRIKKLIGLVDQILIDNPYLKRSLDEAIDPIRKLK